MMLATDRPNTVKAITQMPSDQSFHSAARQNTGIPPASGYTNRR
jgi:hypothetical protein